MLATAAGTGAVLGVFPHDDALRIEFKLRREPVDQILQLLTADLLRGRRDPMPDAILARKAQRIGSCVVEVGGVAAHQDDLVVVLAVADVGHRSLQCTAAG